MGTSKRSRSVDGDSSFPTQCGIRSGRQAAKRARRYMTWKFINDLDEESLRRLLDELPAWVKVCVCAEGMLHELGRQSGFQLQHFAPLQAVHISLHTSPLFPAATGSWLPADWHTGAVTVQFEEFERVAFVNQILVGIWAYLDPTICSAIKEFVEPVIQENLPFPVSGFEFEKLALGDAPFQIRGVKHVSLYDGTTLSKPRQSLVCSLAPASVNT